MDVHWWYCAICECSSSILWNKHEKMLLWNILHEFRKNISSTESNSVPGIINSSTSNGSWCMGIKGEMSGTVCVTFTWDMYIYIWVVYSICFFCCLFITVTWWYVWCIEWASGNQEEVQACLVTLWLFIISCYSLYKTTLGLLCSWFENNPHFHKYSMDFHV